MTINSQLCARFTCCSKSFIKSCDKYSTGGFTSTSHTGSHKQHEPVNRMPKSGWASVTLPAKLGSVDSRSMGPPNRGWLPTRLVKCTIPDSQATPNTNHSRECNSNNSRGCRIVNQRGNCRDSAVSTQLCVPDFPGGEEGWGSEACNKSEGPQPICEARTLQDGGSLPSPRSPPAGGLDGQDGPEGCIPSGPNSPRPSTISHLPMGREKLQIHLPTIWPVISTKDIHQVNETNSRVSKAGGLSPNNIPGRLVDLTSRQGPVTADDSIDLPTFRMFGVDNQSQKISARTDPEAGISWFRDTQSVNDIINSPREIEEDPTGCSQTSGQDISVSKGGSPVCGQSNSYHASSPDGTPSLQSTAIPDELCAPRSSSTGRGDQQIQHCSAVGSNEQVRPIMVDIPRQEVPVNSSRSTSPIHNNRVRCIQQGLGCSAEWPDSDRRSMVSAGTGASHQLPGVASSISSLAGIWEDLDRHSGALPLGQCDGCDIHQPEGGHCLQAAVPVSNHNLELVHCEENHTHSRTPTWSPQYNSGPGVTFSPRPLRLDAQSRNISENPGNDGATEGRPVCLSPDQTTSSILQLESRSGSLGDGCIHAGLVTTAGLCQSTMVFNPSLSLQGKNTISTSSVDHSLLEDSILVSNCAGTPGGLPSNSTNAARSGDAANRPGVSNEAGSAPTDRLAYLRQCYSSQGFSSEASSLMLASWRLETIPTPTMVPPLLNGLAGVTSGVEIPLRDLRYFVP